MKIFVVSISDSLQRRQHITEEFTKHDLAWTFFDALNHQEGLAQAQQLGIEIREDRLSGGEIGCFMSHVAIWQQVVADKIDYMAVFEDDVYLGDTAGKYLKNDQWLAGIGGLIKLETMQVPCILSRKIKKIDEDRRLQRLYSCHWGTAGYIISYPIAQKLLAYVRQCTALAPIDDLVFEYFRMQTGTPIYQMVPAISIQDKVMCDQNQKFDSLVEDERTQKQLDAGKQHVVTGKVRLGAREKIIRELNRLKRQFSLSNIKYILSHRLGASTQEVVKFK